MSELPALDQGLLPASGGGASGPRFLLLSGSARSPSLSQMLVLEAGRVLERLGGEVRSYDPVGLPLPGTAPPDHEKVAELHDALKWADAHIWCSPENYGTVSAVLKSQIEWMPPPMVQGKPLAVAQVCGAGISFNTVVTLSTIGRWLGMLVTPTTLCVPKIQEEFGQDGRMKPSPHYDKLVDLAEELHVLTSLVRGGRGQLVDHYSARKAAAAPSA